jgi:hypothetical protein
MAGKIPKMQLKRLPNILQKSLGGIYSILILRGAIRGNILGKY